MPEVPQTYVDDCLLRMSRAGASDLFLRQDTPPSFRINGKVVRQDIPAPSGRDIHEFMQRVLTPMAAENFSKSPDVDAAIQISGVGRFRVNFFMQQGRLAMVARMIPLGSVDYSKLNMPKGILEFADAMSGLILIVGPTGCGKSTTMAAMINHINANRDAHIMTIEDPIEFVHDEIRSLVNQRQVGSDTQDFATALRHVVRQNPDVIMIGEMRDVDTITTALSAALTGHLVLSTLHTTNVVQSIDRMLNYFPPGARQQAQVDLATTLVGMASMRLLPRKDGAGRVPACEVLRATPTVRRIIMENKLAELYDIMKRSGDCGMCTMNQSLMGLCKSKLVDPMVALQVSGNKDELRLNMSGMFTGIDSIDMRNELADKDKQSPWG